MVEFNLLAALVAGLASVVMNATKAAEMMNTPIMTLVMGSMMSENRRTGMAGE